MRKYTDALKILSEQKTISLVKESNQAFTHIIFFTTNEEVQFKSNLFSFF